MSFYTPSPPCSTTHPHLYSLMNCLYRTKQSRLPVSSGKYRYNPVFLQPFPPHDLPPLELPKVLLMLPALGCVPMAKTSKVACHLVKLVNAGSICRCSIYNTHLRPMTNPLLYSLKDCSCLRHSGLSLA